MTLGFPPDGRYLDAGRNGPSTLFGSQSIPTPEAAEIPGFAGPGRISNSGPCLYEARAAYPASSPAVNGRWKRHWSRSRS